MTCHYLAHRPSGIFFEFLFPTYLLYLNVFSFSFIASSTIASSTVIDKHLISVALDPLLIFFIRVIPLWVIGLTWLASCCSNVSSQLIDAKLFPECSHFT